jgi:oligoendopeptidase F
MVQIVPKRNEVAHAQTWNAESVFPTITAYQAEFASLSETVDAFAAKYKQHMADSPAVLADALIAGDDIGKRIGIVFTYVGMSYNVDTTNQEMTALYGQAIGLSSKVSAGTAFVGPELLQIGLDKLKGWIAQEPRLAVYEHSFERLYRRQEHVRSAEVEEVLGLTEEVFGAANMTYDMLTNADMQFPKAMSSSQEPLDVTQGNIDALMDNADREVRRTAWENYFGVYKAHRNTLSASLTTAVKRQVFQSRVRGYSSALEASMFPENLSTEVYQTLIATFKKHMPIWHRYFDIKRRALGYDKLYPYDVWAPIAKRPPVVPYEQGVTWIADGMKPLGDEYVTTMRRGCLEDRWVDRAANQGKTQGAFSTGGPGTFPFILMTYTDDLQSVSTLAHELGHSMHTYLSSKHQPLVYAGYSLFVAEVASNFNQAMTRAHLLKTNADPDFQIAVITEAMYNFHRYFLQMPTLARFELEMHERAERGQGITADDMVALMADLLTEVYGPAMTIDREMFGMMWATFGHLYANFYVFQYATGISAANALASRILEGTPGASDSYLKFLSTGGSMYPLDALKVAGVDLTTPEPIERAFGVLGGMVDRLEKLVEAR